MQTEICIWQCFVSSWFPWTSNHPPSKPTCWVSVVCCMSLLWRSCYWATRNYLPERYLSTSEGRLWRLGFLVHAFFFWLFTFFSEIKFKLQFLPHLSFLFTTWLQSVQQLCCSFHWLLNLTGKLYQASVGYQELGEERDWDRLNPCFRPLAILWGRQLSDVSSSQRPWVSGAAQSAWGSKMGCTPCCLKRSNHSSSLLLCLTMSLPRPPLALAALFKCTLGLMPSHSCIASCCVVLLYFSLFSDALCHVTCLDILSFVAPKTNKCSLNSVLHMPLSRWDTLMAPLLSL